MTKTAVDNTAGIVAALESGNSEYIAKISTLLGPKYSLPRGGVIRPGIMVLKGGCTAQDENTYREMSDKGASWDEIEKTLGNDAKGKTKLMPSNVDYFTVNPGDCMNPENASIIKSKYADTDGKIRRLPVWFPVNEWWNILPHSLRCWGQSGIKFMSDINNGKTVCRFPIDNEPGKRTFGGRQWGTRPCKPEDCREYQAGECKFGGTIQFYIPGAKGVGIWVLPTTSWYSMVAIKSVLENVAAITGWRLARLFSEAGEPVFVLTKTEEIVASVDLKTGKPVHRKQYLIYLDLNVDMTELALMHERKSISARALDATAKLTNNAATREEPKMVENTPEKVAEPDNATAVIMVKSEPEKKQEIEQKALTIADDSSDAAKKALIKECITYKKEIPDKVYKGIRGKYPEQSGQWTIEETRKIHEELKSALEAAKAEEAQKAASGKAEAAGQEDNGNNELLAEIKRLAISYGVMEAFCSKVMKENVTNSEIAQNWVARLEQGDFSMFLESIA